MANTNNWGEIYNSTWWGDKAYSANSLFNDAAPSGFGLNLLKGSEDMDNTLDWIKKTGATVSGDNTNDPNGELTAERVDFAADQYSRIQQLVTLEASTTYTFSVHARVPSGQPSQDFRLRVFGVSGATGSFTALSSDWTRFDFDFTTTTAGTYTLAIMNDADGASRSVQFWGAMLNEGADVGDYVKTDASFGGSSPSAEYTGFGDEFVGVTAYYSLRQFTEAETLNAIRVRRSSDDTEQDIGFDANGDLDTTALLAFVNEEHTIVDEDFSTNPADNGWTYSTGATWSADVLPFVNSSGGSPAYKEFGSIDAVGTKIRVSFTISNYSGAGTISFRKFGNPTFAETSSDVGTARSGNGTYTEELTFSTVANNVNWGFSTSGNFTGDIDDFEVVQITADGAVTTFYDQSGNGNNATNSTESEQPLVVSGGTLVEENGKAAIDFDGVDDYFTGGAKTTMDNTAIFAVIKSDSNTQDAVFIQNSVDGSNFVALGLGGLGTSNAIGSRLRVGGSTVDSVGDSTFTATDQTLVSYLADNTAGQMFVDGTEETDAVDSRSAGTATTIGARGDGNNPFNGAMQEVIFFNSDQSANRTGIESNINDHFSIYP